MFLLPLFFKSSEHDVQRCPWTSYEAKTTKKSDFENLNPIHMWPEIQKFRFFKPYIHEIFKIVWETSTRSHFKDNFMLNKLLKTCIALKWIFSFLWDPSLNYGFLVSAYIHEIFKIVWETSTRSHFKDNFVLNKLLKTCIALKWIFSFLWDLKTSIMAFLVAAILDLKKMLKSNFKIFKFFFPSRLI